MMKILSIFFLAALATAPAHANFCANWNAPKQISTIENRALVEISGMVISQAVPNTMYMHNDSGSASSFYKTSINGQGQEEILVKGGSAKDVEDIAYGACPGKPNARCLFLADTGDWGGFGGNSVVTFVEELASFPREVRPLGKVSLSYPNGTPNVEALTVHPNGDIYVVSKDKSGARIYRFLASEVASGKARGKDLGLLDLKKILSDDSKQTLVTGMDISADGKKFLVITYLDAVEFNFDLSTISSVKKELIKGQDYSVASLKKLDQQESIAYLPGEKSFLYTSEGENPPLMQVDCRN